MIHGLFSLIFLAIYIYVAYWVYTDASKRGMNAILWGILSFLFCPIVPVIYFIIRKPVGSSPTL